MDTPQKERRFVGAILRDGCLVEAWISVGFEGSRDLSLHKFGALLDHQYPGGVILTRDTLRRCWPMHAASLQMDPEDTQLSAYVQLGVLGQMIYGAEVPIELSDEPRQVVIGRAFLSHGVFERDERVGKWTWSVKAKEVRSAGDSPQ